MIEMTVDIFKQDYEIRSQTYKWLMQIYCSFYIFNILVILL